MIVLAEVATGEVCQEQVGQQGQSVNKVVVSGDGKDVESGRKSAEVNDAVQRNARGQSERLHWHWQSHWHWQFHCHCHPTHARKHTNARSGVHEVQTFQVEVGAESQQVLFVPITLQKLFCNCFFDPQGRPAPLRYAIVSDKYEVGFVPHPAFLQNAPFFAKNYAQLRLLQVNHLVTSTSSDKVSKTKDSTKNSKQPKLVSTKTQ